MACRIEISELELLLHIGCTERERSTSQPIRFRTVVTRAQNFQACETDLLHDTLDAQEIRSALIESANHSRVQTLERLGQVIESDLRKNFSFNLCDWELTISKPRFGWSYVHAWSS